MIGNYKLQPNYGLDADNHKSTNLHNYSQSISELHRRAVIKHEYTSEKKYDEDYVNLNVKEEEEVEIFDELDEEQPSINDNSNQEVDDNIPVHHTRRPMNAFFMFCNRHRLIVKEKFPNSQNRAITKILGGWWAYIDEAEKVSYRNLAKEYKQAFVSAHPNFKWYKPPTPRPRTISTRRAFNRKPTSISEDDHGYVAPHIANYDCFQVKHEFIIEEVDEFKEEVEDEADYVDNNEPLRNISTNYSIFDRTSTSFSEANHDYVEPHIANYNCIPVKQEINFEEVNEYKEEMEAADNADNNESEIKNDNNECTKLINNKLNFIEHNLSLNEVSILNVNNNQSETNEIKDENRIDCKKIIPSSSVQPVTLFKLADMKQMCGLNTLMQVDNQSVERDGSSRNNAATSNKVMDDPNEANKMQEDSTISKFNISNNLKRKIDSATTTTPPSPIDTPLKRNLKDFATSNNNHNIDKEIVKNESVGKQSLRACKGQWNDGFMINPGKFLKSTNKINKSAISQFATEEFDLEKRINALPTVSLDFIMKRKR